MVENITGHINPEHAKVKTRTVDKTREDDTEVMALTEIILKGTKL